MQVGSGYEKKAVSVINVQGMKISAFTYYATKIDNTILPYTWYKHHVLEGAKSADLSEEYIAKLEQTKAMSDSDHEREKRELSIYE